MKNKIHLTVFNDEIMLKFHVCNVTVKVLSDKYTATISEL